MNKLFFVLSLTIAPFAFAVTLTPAAVPKNLHVYDQNGNTYVNHVVQHCTSKAYYIDPNHKAYDQLVAILLSAQIAQKKVVLRYDGCTNRGTQGKVIGVYLK